MPSRAHHKKVPEKENSAVFRFYGCLNDFLRFDRRKVRFWYTFRGNPAVKDTIEAIGVPHIEVDCIFVNGTSVDFYHQLDQNDKIHVYPAGKKPTAPHTKHLKARPLKHPKFILDSHLGKLARNLRLLGIDTLYQKYYPDEDIIKEAKKGKRIVLTRDIGLLKNKIIKRGYWVRAIDPKKQIKEIIREFNLHKEISPFALCLECNGKIIRVKKSSVADLLAPKTREYYSRFYMCKRCKKIYWKGSHYKWLSGFVKNIRKNKM